MTTSVKSSKWFIVWAAAALVAAASSAAQEPAAAPAGAPAKSTAQIEAGEPRANTSAPPLETPSEGPSRAPPQAAAKKPAAGAPASSAKSAPSKAPGSADRLDLGTATVTGDREQPKVMYIVPWKNSEIGDLSGKPMNSLLDEALAPVDREEFKREVVYYQAVRADAAQSGAKPPKQGEK